MQYKHFEHMDVQLVILIAIALGVFLAAFAQKLGVDITAIVPF